VFPPMWPFCHYEFATAMGPRDGTGYPDLAVLRRSYLRSDSSPPWHRYPSALDLTSEESRPVRCDFAMRLSVTK
jgi:hypothetical protein